MRRFRVGRLGCKLLMVKYDEVWGGPGGGSGWSIMRRFRVGRVGGKLLMVN